VGLTLGAEVSELMPAGDSGFSVSKIGVRKDINEEIHAAGFLMRILKSNFEAFFGALAIPGAERRKNPNRANMAANLRVDFFGIATSLERRGFAFEDEIPTNRDRKAELL